MEDNVRAACMLSVIVGIVCLVITGLTGCDGGNDVDYGPISSIVDEIVIDNEEEEEEEEKLSFRDVTLEWDESISDNIEGYKIYYSTMKLTGRPFDMFSFEDFVVDVGDQLRYTIKGLEGQIVWYAVATCYRGDEESGYSNEVFIAKEEK